MRHSLWVSNHYATKTIIELNCCSRGAGSEVWNLAYMIAPVKKFGRVGLCTNFIPNKHGGGEEGELAELAVIWCTRVCVGSALFPLFQV